MPGFFDTKIEFLKGVGPQKAAVLNKELNIFNFGDLLAYFPFRYEDRSVFYHIGELDKAAAYAQVKGRIKNFRTEGQGRKRRLVAIFADETGEMELVWFQGVAWISKAIQKGVEYIVYGKPAPFSGKWSMAHPEMELLTAATEKPVLLQPVYSATEKLKSMGLDSKGISKLLRVLLPQSVKHIQEILPASLLDELRLMPRSHAFLQIHFPDSQQWADKAVFRLKFEELFLSQMKILHVRTINQAKNKGYIFQKLPGVNAFYKDYLPFQLTNAQKKVIREIYADVCSGRQMNRLIQGDVGSGKTIVAFIAMLMAIDGRLQACLMAPTEILASQHYKSLKTWADAMGLHIALLTGSTRKSERDRILEDLQTGYLHIIIGTHALLEDRVQFHRLGICVIDEQHRFGVAQRARLWNKNEVVFPHILVMTATPIPRTLAMTLYGDLDVSVIDEMPVGRKPIVTIHKFESQRLWLFGFMKKEIAKGRQVYVVYPLIEESEKTDLADLMNGYEALCKAFPKPDFQLSIVHGRQNPKDKEFEMQRFKKGETQIMVATTVVEVGVNVPNATLMVVENAERFGLAQLHQLRGRVGRGGEQSYCILMTGNKLSSEGRERLHTLVRTTNGFEIAEADLKLRGPGDMMGTKQSGVVDLVLANLAKDGEILHAARQYAFKLLEADPDMKLSENATLNVYLKEKNRQGMFWGMIG